MSAQVTADGSYAFALCPECEWESTGSLWWVTAQLRADKHNERKHREEGSEVAE